MSIEKVNNQIKTLKSKKNKILMFTPDSSVPSALTYEIYFHAHILQKNGYDVTIIVDSDGYEKPYWIEDEILDVKVILDSKINLNVTAVDMLIIPEMMSNIFEQTKNLPCIRVGFLQSIDYMLNSLIMGVTWNDLNIKNVITTSERLGEMFKNIMQGNYNIQHYDLGIPSYFENRVKNKKPIISMVYRNKNDINKIAKIFYLKYPHFRWITFDGMLNDDATNRLGREDFARRLDESFISIWVDKIASLGTFPIESLKCKTIPICLVPDIHHDYMDDAYMTDNIYDIPDMIATMLNLYLNNNEEFMEYFETVDYSKKYTQEKSSVDILNIYENLMNERLISLEKYLEVKNEE